MQTVFRLFWEPFRLRGCQTVASACHCELALKGWREWVCGVFLRLAYCFKLGCSIYPHQRCASSTLREELCFVYSRDKGGKKKSARYNLICGYMAHRLTKQYREYRPSQKILWVLSSILSCKLLVSADALLHRDELIEMATGWVQPLKCLQASGSQTGAAGVLCKLQLKNVWSYRLIHVNVNKIYAYWSQNGFNFVHLNIFLYFL